MLDVRRRQFITLLGGAAAAWPLTARAQQGAPMRRIGVLMGFAETDPNAQHLVAAFRSALANLGQMEGSNVLIELRWAAGDTSRMRTFARELVELRLDVIVAQTTPVLRAVANETRTIPIVFTVVTDPIGMGLAANITRRFLFYRFTFRIFAGFVAFTGWTGARGAMYPKLPQQGPAPRPGLPQNE